MEAVSSVLPFRVNNYIVDELIDWDAEDDPIHRLVFPQREMLAPADFRTMRDLVSAGAGTAELENAARRIRECLNPHPAGQLEMNVPRHRGRVLAGVQHKYRETVLFFPSAGQTCHAYCTYCFRWPQFVGGSELTFAAREVAPLVEYLKAHPEVTDVLLTGGDPLVMRTRVLRRYLEPLLGVDSVRTIRIGSKAPAWWPHRFTSGEDAEALLRLFEEVVESGRHLALMAHYSHPVELSTQPAQEALRRIRSTGAVVRCQAPLVQHVNDSSDTWVELWKAQVRAGAVPYYMFVQRDTGPRKYFQVSLARALRIYTTAIRQVSGLARTARGPSMSSTPGKILIDGTAIVDGETVFVLKFLQGREVDWAGQIFFARYDESAAWIDEMKPASGQDRFFFERPRSSRLRVLR
jgi:KamA family protein